MKSTLSHSLYTIMKIGKRKSSNLRNFLNWTVQSIEEGNIRASCGQLLGKLFLRVSFWKERSQFIQNIIQIDNEYISLLPFFGPFFLSSIITFLNKISLAYSKLTILLLSGSSRYFACFRSFLSSLKIHGGPELVFFLPPGSLVCTEDCSKRFLWGVPLSTDKHWSCIFYRGVHSGHQMRKKYRQPHNHECEPYRLHQ